MSYIDQKLLALILMGIRSSVPTVGPDLFKGEDISIVETPVDTGLGFSLDHWDVSVRLLYNMLGYISLFDLPPSNPDNNKLLTESVYIKHRTPESEEPINLTQFLISGTGSYFLQPQENGYLADFSSYEQYDVRPGYYKYGGKVYLEDGQITKFMYLGIDYLPSNELIEKIIRSTLCLKIMVEIHALRIHLATSQSKALWYYSPDFRYYRLDDLFYLLTFQTLTVNRKIALLISPQGFIPRLFALTTESYTQLMATTLAAGPLSGVEILGTPGTVWNKQLTKYRKLVTNYIIDLNTSTPDLNLTSDEINEITDFMVVVTALHNQFGDSQVYSMVISHFFLPKVYTSCPGHISSLDQDILNTLMVAVTPQFPYLIDDITRNIFSHHRQRACWDKFINKLKIKFTKESWFNPRYFETSVGF